MLPSVPTLTLSILPFPYTPSPPPNIFHDLSSFLCLKWTMYIAFICNSHSFIVGGSKLHSKLWFFYLYYLVLCSWTKYEIWWNMKYSAAAASREISIDTSICHLSISYRSLFLSVYLCIVYIYLDVYLHLWYIYQYVYLFLCLFLCNIILHFSISLDLSKSICPYIKCSI